MKPLLARLGIAAVLTPMIKYGLPFFGHEIAWWGAITLALILVFLGEWILEAFD